MVTFGIILIILFLFSLFGFKSDDAFSKQKTLFLKVFMAVAIILGHLSCRVPSAWIQPFRFWGAPFVSMFLFTISLGLWDVAEFLIQSRSFLFINFEKNLENRVTIFIHGAIVFYNSKTSKWRVQY